MNDLFQYEQVEINENKCRYSFDEEYNYECLEKLVPENFPKDCTFSLKDLLFKAEKNNYFKPRIENCDIKERILLTSINDLKAEIDNNDFQFIEFDNNKNMTNENKDYNNINSLFIEIDKMVHLTLHKKKMINGKEIKDCNFYDNEQLFEFGKNVKNNNIDKKIVNLKKENKNFEFFTIKSIMISLTNLISEYVQKYLAKNKEGKKIEFDLEKLENFDIIIEPNIFEDIYKDFVYQSNLCSSELEEYFIISLNCFRKKYQMNFTLSELFTDIFWNIIFHNKELCNSFINFYLNEEIYGDIKIYLKKIMKIILSVNIPLKHQIVELLQITQLNSYEKNDLMTLIVEQKKLHHNEIVALEKEKENLNKINNNKKLEEININKNENKNNNLIINNLKNVESIKYNIITANDISTLKKQNPSLLSVCNSNNKILNKENNIKKEKENKEKEIKREENNKNYVNKKNKEKFAIDDMEHKTVDEIYNYINDDKIVKNKKKKKSRKNRKNKKEEIMVEQNQEEIEDSIVIKFKEDLSDKLIHARSITKIKPIISESWIKYISDYK